MGPLSAFLRETSHHKAKIASFSFSFLQQSLVWHPNQRGERCVADAVSHKTRTKTVKCFYGASKRYIASSSLHTLYCIIKPITLPDHLVLCGKAWGKSYTLFYTHGSSDNSSKSSSITIIFIIIIYCNALIVWNTVYAPYRTWSNSIYYSYFC